MFEGKFVPALLFSTTLIISLLSSHTTHFTGIKHSPTMNYELQLANPKEFYHEAHRVTHFTNFSYAEENEAATADREDVYA